MIYSPALSSVAKFILKLVYLTLVFGFVYVVIGAWPDMGMWVVLFFLPIMLVFISGRLERKSLSILLKTISAVYTLFLGGTLGGAAVVYFPSAILQLFLLAILIASWARK